MMVWGMALPDSFGAFFPNGDYVGWRKGLMEYFENEMPAERKALFGNALAYPYYVSQKFTEDPEKEGSKDAPPFSPVEPHEAPKRFTLQRNYKSLGSLFKTESCILAMDEPLKDIIERFEPGVHRFFPLEISMPDIEQYPRRFFILAIGQYIDSFSAEQSEPDSWAETGLDHYPYSFKADKNSMSGLALSKQAFGTAHLWRERRMLSELICFSDTLTAEINKAGLRMPKHYRLKEV